MANYVSVPVRGKGGLEVFCSVLGLQFGQNVSVPVRGKGGLEGKRSQLHFQVQIRRFRPREGKGWSRSGSVVKVFKGPHKAVSVPVRGKGGLEENHG